MKAARLQGIKLNKLVPHVEGLPKPQNTAFAIARAAVMTANEMAAKHINVNAIAPGYIATDNTQALQDDPNRSKAILERIPQGRWGTPRDFAGPAVFLASSASDYVNGEILVVDGGWMGR
jgi:2-deoxy-D-gluconate 3-dehydrogenase